MKSLNSFKLISELREVREFNYKQLIGYVPKQPDDSLSKTLTIKMNELLRENSFHLYDTLKLLRKKLNIKENVKVKEKLLFDEKEISSLSYIDQKTVSDKILIVDDDSDTLYTVGDMIKELNYTVEFAEDGYSALESIQEAKPALILLDIMMPGMDGFETVRKIREFYKPESLPVLALTAYAMIDDKEVLKRNGFNDLVSKPVKMVDLKNKIEQFLVNQEELNYEQNISSG
jgi:CheY-like chemotaxis protein